MRRTDRLFEIIQLFRGGQLLLAREIAENLEVSVRTVYRDIDTLIGSGIPIEGERGVGYILREPIFLPPLNLSTGELEALQLGMEIVQQTSDSHLADSAKRLLDKINAVLPSDRGAGEHLKHLAVYASFVSPALEHLHSVRAAIANRQIIHLQYQSLENIKTNRRIRPLQVEYWGKIWTLVAWCEARDAFRMFRVDRIVGWNDTGETFLSDQGKSYKDYLAQLPVQK